MLVPNQILYYVADVPRSAALYAQVLGQSPMQQSDNFAMFALPNGTILAFWGSHEVEPKATVPGGSELGFTVDTDEAVSRTCGAWAKLGLEIIQQPTRMAFGFTGTARDTDGIRLRVFAPSP